MEQELLVVHDDVKVREFLTVVSECFRQHDMQGDGKINKLRLKRVLEIIGLDGCTSLGLIDQVSEDEEGNVGYEKFLTSMAMKLPLREGQLATTSEMQKLRGESPDDQGQVLLLCIREFLHDSNEGGEVLMSGKAVDLPNLSRHSKLVTDLGTELRKSCPDAAIKTGQVAKWNVVWEDTKMTKGAHASYPFFPIGKKIHRCFDVLADHGWSPAGAHEYGRTREDVGIHPVMVFEPNRLPDGEYDKHHSESLFFVVQHGADGKLCACGPSDTLRILDSTLTSRLREFNPAVKVQSDSEIEADAWDMVWENIPFNSRSTEDRCTQEDFPSGDVYMAFLEQVYNLKEGQEGWHLVATPNFGDWPCFVFKRLLNRPARAPAIIMAAQQTLEGRGKLCLTGAKAEQVSHRLLSALSKDGSEKISLRKCEDDDWDEVLRNVDLTTIDGCNLLLHYNNASAIFETMRSLGWSLTACPRLHGPNLSVPSFIWEWDGYARKSAVLALMHGTDYLQSRIAIAPGLHDQQGEVESIFSDIGSIAFIGVSKHEGISGCDHVFNMSLCKRKNLPYGMNLEAVLLAIHQRGWRSVSGPQFEKDGKMVSTLVIEGETFESPCVEEGLSALDEHHFEGRWWDSAEKAIYDIVANGDRQMFRVFSTSCSTLMFPFKGEDGYDWMQGDELHSNGLYIRKLRIRLENELIVRKIWQKTAWSTPAWLSSLTLQQKKSQGKCLTMESLWTALEKGDTILIRASWLMKWAITERTLPRRQDLPEEAVWDIAELKCKVQKFDAILVAVSYCWGSLEHPDPYGEQMRLLGSLLERRFAVEYQERKQVFQDAGLFIDWCSLYQPDRSPEEQRRFQRSLKHCYLWYAHECVESWLLTRTDEGVWPYEERGWPMFEKAVSSMVTPDHMLMDMGKYDDTRHPTWAHIYGACKAGRQPPQAPIEFNNELETKRFTNSVDLAMVKELYRCCFEAVLSNVKELAFSNLNWGDDEAHILAGSLFQCHRCEKMDLKSNDFGPQGVGAIMDAAAQCPKMEVISFTTNRFGDEGAAAIARALPKCRSIVTVWLNETEIGDEGMKALANVLPLCHNIRNLYLFDNAITDESFETLRTMLPKCPGLMQFGIGGNDFIEEHFQTLQEVWKDTNRRDPQAVIYIR